MPDGAVTEEQKAAIVQESRELREEFTHRIHGISSRPSVDDIPRIERRVSELESRLRAMEEAHSRGIPELPAKEVPEEGYRAIRDALLDLYGDKLDPTKSTAVQVIALLKEHRYNCDQAEMPREPIECERCGWKGYHRQTSSHQASAGGRSWTDYLCPKCNHQLDQEYDPDPEWDDGRENDDNAE
jgi:ribosomal protein L37E